MTFPYHHNIASISTAAGMKACSRDEDKATPFAVAVLVAAPESADLLTSVAPTITVEVDVGAAVPAQIPLSPLHVARAVSVGATNVVFRGNALPVPMLVPVPPVPTAVFAVVDVGEDMPPLKEKRAE